MENRALLGTPGQSPFQLFLVWLGCRGPVLALCSLTHTSLDYHQTPVKRLFLHPSSFSRTESVAEKMLTNWFAFLLHKFLKVKRGE